MTPQQQAEMDYLRNKSQKLHEVNEKLNAQVIALQEQNRHWKLKANREKK